VIGLIQRVSNAQVVVETETIATINVGIVALIGIEKSDTTSNADRLLQRIVGYRIFPDLAGKMNLSLTDIQGDLLLIPQFTLPADTRKGMRPSFSAAATPETGAKLFTYLYEQAGQTYKSVSTGKFGADMQVTLTNDGPVTFWIQA